MKKKCGVGQVNYAFIAFVVEKQSFQIVAKQVEKEEFDDRSTIEITFF